MERKLIAVAVSTALGLPMAADAVEFSASGMVNRAIIIADGGKNADGTDKYDGEMEHVESNQSESRLTFAGSEELDSGMTVGVNLELGLGGQLYGYDGVEDEGEPDAAKNDLRIRHQNVYISTEGGKITLGQASSTAGNVPYANMGGLSGMAGVTNWCTYGVKHGNGCNTNDAGRIRLLRYDAPALGPVSLAGSVGEDDYWDVMAKVAGGMGDTGYDIRFGYQDEDTMTFSGSVGFATGTAVTVAWGQDDPDDATHGYAAIDQSYGAGSVGVFFRRGETAGADGSMWGVGVGHDLGGNAQAYAGFRSMEDGSDDDVTLMLVGMRVKFN